VIAIADQDGDPNSQNDDIWITYTLWIGTEVEKEYNLNLKIAENTSFYHVMEVASQLNPTFNFKADDSSVMGHFITEIAGVANNETNSTYWMIYILPRRPRKDSPPTDKDLSPVGVDSIEVQENKHYLFWYKYVKF
ncbi:hypothetical protein AMK59_3333, partial [Oryctes borbonicus]